MIFVNIRGSNATGKSTRVRLLYEYLVKEKGYIPKPIIWEKNGKSYGHMLGDIFFFGQMTNKGWVGLDSHILTKNKERLEFIKYVNDNFPEIKYYIQEGYFNNRSPVFHTFKTMPYIEDIWNVFFIYNTVDDFIMRVKERQRGKTRYKTREEAEKSSGWGENEGCKRHSKLFSENPDLYGKVFVYKYDAPKDILIQLIYGERYEKKELNLLNMF